MVSALQRIKINGILPAITAVNTIPVNISYFLDFVFLGRGLFGSEPFDIKIVIHKYLIKIFKIPRCFVDQNSKNDQFSKYIQLNLRW